MKLVRNKVSASPLMKICLTDFFELCTGLCTLVDNNSSTFLNLYDISRINSLKIANLSQALAPLGKLYSLKECKTPLSNVLASLLSCGSMSSIIL